MSSGTGPEEIRLAEVSQHREESLVRDGSQQAGEDSVHGGSHVSGRMTSRSVRSAKLEPQTEELIHYMPSVAGDTVVQVDQNQKSKKKRAGNYATLRMRPGKEVDLDQLARDLMEGEDATDGTERITENIRGMTTTLSNKKAIKDKVVEKHEGSKVHKVGCCRQTAYSLSISWRHFKHSLSELAYSLKFWKNHLKTIEGHFGTGVTSYFIFLRGLFILNIPVFILTFAFVTIPQLLFRWQEQEPRGYTQNISFQGWELLTGGGWFEDTELYYGYYINGTVGAKEEYDMRYAYLFTSAGYYLLTVIILGYVLLKSYKKNFIQVSGDLNYPVMKVFCGWDYNVCEAKAARLKHKAIFKDLQEYLSVYRTDDDMRSCIDWCGVLLLRVFTNLLVIGLLAGSGYIIWYISITQSLKVTSASMITSAQQLFEELAMPLCISGINFILPFAFSILASFERFRQPRTELYFTMVRTMLLNVATLGVLVYFWFTNVNCASVDFNDQRVLDSESECSECWEDFIGQQIYRLVVVDFIFVVIVTFLAEFVRRVMSQYCCKSLSYPEFNIGRNSLNLIYSQILVWIGTFYSPLLSLIMILKLFLTFYIKRVSVVQNCVPSVKPWRAGQTTTIIQGLTLLAFLACFVATAYSVFFLVPSETCGPYQGYNRSYDIITLRLEDWRETGAGEVIASLLDIITSVAFLIFLLVALCVGAHYARVTANGHEEMVQLLRKQIAMEGRDKTFLLKLLNEACRRAGPNAVASLHKPYTSANFDTTAVNLPTPQSGKAFSKAKIAAGSSATPPSTGPRRRVAPGTGFTTAITDPKFFSESHNPGFQQVSLERDGVQGDSAMSPDSGLSSSQQQLSTSNPVYRDDSLTQRPNLPYPQNPYQTHK